MIRYSGVSSKEVASLVDKFGLNELPKQRNKSKFEIFISQFKSFFVLLLLLAVVISLFLSEYVDAVVISLIVVLNASIGSFQEFRAKKEVEELKKLIVSKSRVIRDSQEQLIETRYIVPGDIIVLTEGDKIPADGRIVESKYLAIDESSLTGESLPVEKKNNDEVYLSTIVIKGRALLLVEKIGSETKFGMLAKTLATIPEEKTPLEIKLDVFSKKIGFVILLLVFLFFVIGFIQERNMYLLFFSSISLAVAAIPEGLPAVLTVTMALGVHRLSKKKAIVKRLVATESLGTVDVICTDKTGTLTKNEMTVRNVITSKKIRYEVTGTGYSSKGDILHEGKKITSRNELEKIFHVCVICNTSALVKKDNDTYGVLGDTMEGALSIFSIKGDVDIQKYKNDFEIQDEIPFDSIRKLMTVVTKDEILVKGAPENLIERCNLNEKDRSYFNQYLREESKKGYRMLGLAEKKVEKNTPLNQIEQNLNFLGIIGIYDSPRPEVRDSVAQCRKAGIKVVMITGDSKETAQAIGEEVGIFQKGDEIINGDKFSELSDEELVKKLATVSIFSRVTSSDKLRIVEAFQKIGKSVAVTGDGVNDAAALKKAQVGVAMGISGTDVAKEASDLIISDDNFTTIVAAIEEGRVIYLNLIKVIKYLLASNSAEVMIVLFSTIFWLPLPLTPLALLWLNIVSDGFPSLAVAFDRGERVVLGSNYAKLGIENDFLSKKNIRSIFIVGLFASIVAMIIFTQSYLNGLEYARNITLVSFVFVEMIILLYFRGLKNITKNKLLIVVIFMTIALQVVIFLFKPFYSLFI